MPDIPESTTTAAAILTAAHGLFLRGGYSGTSMRAIANEAGIALGGIYNHFESKEAIFREVILTYHPYHEILPALENANHPSIEALFTDAAQRVEAALHRKPDLFNLMYIEIVEFQSRHMPDLLEQILPQAARTLAKIQAADDSLRPIQTPMLWRVFIGMLLGYFLSGQALGATTPPGFGEDGLEHFMNVFFHGILKTEASL